MTLVTLQVWRWDIHSGMKRGQCLNGGVCIGGALWYELGSKQVNAKGFARQGANSCAVRCQLLRVEVSAANETHTAGFAGGGDQCRAVSTTGHGCFDNGVINGQ